MNVWSCGVSLRVRLTTRIRVASTGDIKAFFSSGKKTVKAEAVKPKEAVKREKTESDATVAPMLKPMTATDTLAPKTETIKQTPSSPVRSEGFVLASSLLGKRSASSAGELAVSKSSWSSPTRSAPSPQTKKLKSTPSPRQTAVKRGAKSPAGAAGKKQGTLLAFFQPK